MFIGLMVFFDVVFMVDLAWHHAWECYDRARHSQGFTGDILQGFDPHPHVPS